MDINSNPSNEQSPILNLFCIRSKKKFLQQGDLNIFFTKSWAWLWHGDFTQQFLIWDDIYLMWDAQKLGILPVKGWRLPQIHSEKEIGRDAAAYIFHPLKLWLAAVRSRASDERMRWCCHWKAGEKSCARGLLDDILVQYFSTPSFSVYKTQIWNLINQGVWWVEKYISYFTKLPKLNWCINWD